MRKVCYILMSVLSCASFVFAEGGEFTIEDFAKGGYTTNFTGGKRGDFFDGIVKKKAPWCASAIVGDRQRKTALKIEYDVTRGEAGYVSHIKRKYIVGSFKGIMFYAKGDTDALIVRCTGAVEHDYVVEGITDSWQRFIVPYTALSKYSLFDPKKITDIRFVLRDDIVSAQTGKLYLDDLTLVYAIPQEDSADDFPAPSRILKINDKAGALKQYPAQHLSCMVKYTHDYARDDLRTMRFEVSLDKEEWFYVAEDSVKDDIFFSGTWDARFFEQGVYWIRAVAVYDNNRRGEGRPIRLSLANTFNYDSAIDQCMRKNFAYFLSERDEETGLIRAYAGSDSALSTTASGFALTALCAGVEYGYIDRAEALTRVRTLLAYYLQGVSSVAGFYPEVVGRGDAQAVGDIVATAYLAAGAVTCASYFDADENSDEQEVRRLAQSLTNQIRWKSAVDEQSLLLGQKIHADGSLEGQLAGYDEGMLAYVLAIASAQFGIKPESWDAWAATYTFDSYGPYTVLRHPSLSVHQLPLIWLDLTRKKDAYVDYVDNARKVTYINREYALRQNDYEGEVWGLTPCRGPKGFFAYGAPPPKSNHYSDGTVCPSASISSLSLTPTLSKAAVCSFLTLFDDKIWGKYGLYESCNPKEGYYQEVYSALHVGNSFLNAVNYRSGLIHRVFMKSAHVKRALQKMGFVRS